MKSVKNNFLTIKIIKDKLDAYIPSDYKIKKWANLAFNSNKKSTIYIKLSNQNEIMKLNKKFFKKIKHVMFYPFPIIHI